MQPVQPMNNDQRRKTLDQIAVDNLDAVSEVMRQIEMLESHLNAILWEPTTEAPSSNVMEKSRPAPRIVQHSEELSTRLSYVILRLEMLRGRVALEHRETPCSIAGA